MERKISRFVIIAGLAVIFISVMSGVVLEETYAAEGGRSVSAAGSVSSHGQWFGAAVVIGAALAVGAACVGAGYAVGKVGAAAIGAITERPELLARSLLFVGLAEGIAIYGLVIAVMLLKKL